jgi:hypothetical protein
MNEAFLVYRPVMDYEESLVPYLIFKSGRSAAAAVKRMRDYAQAIQEKIPEYDSESETWWDDRMAVVKAAKWPFGIDLSGDIGYGYSKFNPASVDLMPLPLNLKES